MCTLSTSLPIHVPDLPTVVLGLEVSHLSTQHRVDDIDDDALTKTFSSS